MWARYRVFSSSSFVCSFFCFSSSYGHINEEQPISTPSISTYFHSVVGPKDELASVKAKIKSWLAAVKVLVRTLFYGERIPCDHVCAASDTIWLSCFREIMKDGATLLFRFPDAQGSKKSPAEKMFRLLDMHMAISENWTEIKAIFAFDSTTVIQSLAVNSLICVERKQSFESWVLRGEVKKLRDARVDLEN